MSKALDNRALRAFVIVAREGNVSRAAEKLHLTQPAVSLQIKQLSELLGFPLFTRMPNGVILTRDGAQLLAHAERALDAHADFLQMAERMRGGVRGKLRIGTVLDPEFTRLGEFLKQLVAIAPEVSPELRQGMSGEVREALLRGDLDVGYYIDSATTSAQKVRNQRVLVHKTLPKSIWAKTLISYTYRVIAPTGWGPQIHGRSWNELVRLPWVITPAHSVHSRLLNDALSPLGLSLNGVAQVDQEASMLALVRSGVGLSLARDSLAISESQTHGLAIADRVALNAELCFICHAKQRERDIVQVAFDALGRVWKHERAPQPNR
ncbi:MAG: LysR family transcriptional regulator [Betaproteobacteria bacterium]|nr:MAG: LysR family transcriptional regulator [Betaproteobacteria bacterium]